jgi:hypothetical protein
MGSKSRRFAHLVNSKVIMIVFPGKGWGSRTRSNTKGELRYKQGVFGKIQKEAKYFEQAGVYVRMALLKEVMG